MAKPAPTTPRKRPRQARSRATVEAILEGAAQVFCRLGYAGGTTDRIAERAGVSVGSVYQYFPNKDAILVALTERHIDAGFARVRELLAHAIAEPPPLEPLLRGFVEAMIALHEHNPELHRVLFEDTPLPPEFRSQLRARELALAGEVRALLEAHPEVDARDLDASAYVVVHTIEGLVHAFVLHPPDGLDAARLTDEVVRMLSRTLSAARAGP